MMLTVCVLYNLWTLIVRQSFPELQVSFPHLVFFIILSFSLFFFSFLFILGVYTCHFPFTTSHLPLKRLRIGLCSSFVLGDTLLSLYPKELVVMEVGYPWRI